MKLNPFFTRLARFWFKRFPSLRNQLFARNHFRKWCVDKELLVITLENFRMYASPHDYASYSIYFFGLYDSLMTWFIKARLTPGAVCFDVGTDRGWFSLLMGSIVGEAGKVYSFEPYPPNFSKLNQNLDVNQFSWVSAHNLAICDQTGKMNFRPPSDTVTHHESFLSDCSGVGYLSHQKEAGSIEVETTSIDQFVAQHVIDRLDLIKIDIEGAETAALIGAMNTIRQLRPILLIEYNRETAIRAGSSIEALDDLIESMDYDRYTFYGRLEKLNLKKWDGVSDTQAVFNVYCLPRNILRA